MDFNWNALFNINNPDIPQTPLLSTQELQEDLSLWSNAQSNFENTNATNAATVTPTTTTTTATNMVNSAQQQPISLSATATAAAQSNYLFGMLSPGGLVNLQPAPTHNSLHHTTAGAATANSLCSCHKVVIFIFIFIY